MSNKELDLEVTPIVEDMFFSYLSINGDVDEKIGNRLAERVRRKYSAKEISAAMLVVMKMIRNMKKYGIPCSEWPD